MISQRDITLLLSAITNEMKQSLFDKLICFELAQTPPASLCKPNIHTYLLTYLFTYLLIYLLHGAE